MELSTTVVDVTVTDAPRLRMACALPANVELRMTAWPSSTWSATLPLEAA